MNKLTTIDYTAIIIYFSALVAIGFYLKKMASRSLDNYFLGGKKLPWWALGISGMASWLDMTGTMIIASFLYMLGPRGLFIEFRGGVALPLAFMIIWTGKWHRRSNCMTGAEWMVYRFGDGFGGQFARVAVSVATIIGTIGMLAYLIKGAGLFLSMFVPFSPFVCALVLVTVATLYTTASGFFGVVITDIFQSAIIMTAVIVISVMAIGEVNNYPDFAALAGQITGNTQWASVVPHWHTHMPSGYEVYSDLAMFAFFYFLRNVIGGCGTGAAPMYFGARNERECSKLSFLWGWLLMFRWPLMLGFAILGIVVIAKNFPDASKPAEVASIIQQSVGPVEKSQWADAISKIIYNPAEQSPQLIEKLKTLLGDDWGDKLHLVSYEGTIDPERIVPAVILLSVPTGLRGLILIALVAAAMTTFSSTVNMTAGYFTKDIYQRYLRPKASNHEMILISGVFIVFLGVMGFVSAYSVKNINDIWDWIAMGLGGGLLVPSILRLYWWRFNGGGFTIGTLVGLVAAITQRLVWPELDSRWQFIIIGSIGFAATIIGTYITRPTDKSVLENFYRTTRPFGIWGNLPAILTTDVRKAMKKEHVNDILAIPFMLAWMITLFLLPMSLMLKNYDAVIVLGGIFLVSLVGIYRFWYLNLPAEPVKEK